jgi:signal transduction histidine kinase
VLNAARLRADENASAGDRSDRGARQGQRAAEDAALAAERSIADAEISHEREERRRAIGEVFRREREATDLHLSHERVTSDQAVAAREAFLGMVNHDLRTLVGGIALNLALLVKDVVDDERGRRIITRVDAIERFTGRMNRLVDDLLDVVGIQAGKLSVVRAPHDALAVAREAIGDMAPSASAKGIALSPELTGDAVIVPFDHDRVLQTLENLIGNAVKFTPSGGRVLLRVERTDGVVRFTVEDTGPGVAGDVRAVFEPFAQGTNLSRHGLGLGLYISRCIVDAHGGKIWVDKTSKEGSVFCFTLPVS